MNQTDQRDLARLLATLRRECRQQSGLDARLTPPDKETAYRVARQVEEELGLEVVGWKIAAMKEEMQRQLRTDAPIYGRSAARSPRSSTRRGWLRTCRRAPSLIRSRR